MERQTPSFMSDAVQPLCGTIQDAPGNGYSFVGELGLSSQEATGHPQD